LRNALVTGSAGFVGRHFTRRLREDGWHVDALDPASELPTEQYDARDFFMTNDQRYDLVVHAAASAPWRKAIDEQPVHFSYNVQLDSSMFAWAHRTRPKQVVYLSSSAAYPLSLQDRQAAKAQRRLGELDINLGDIAEPHDVYGLTKLLGERMAKAYIGCDNDCLVVRPFSGYGEDQTEDFPFGAIVERAHRGEDPIAVQGNGNQVRDFIHVDDIVEATMRMLRWGVKGPVNLGTGIGHSMIGLARMAALEMGIMEPRVRTEAKTDDQPAGAGVYYRVADPRVLHQYYHPRVSLAAGIRRRLEN
jgi:nucleoside-diphosphate-sugar epimerase